jgi:hypothetical protein
VLGDDLAEVVVDAARDDARTRAQRAVQAELREDRAADELALVGELVEEVRQVVVHLERDDLGLLRLVLLVLRHDDPRG